MQNITSENLTKKQNKKTFLEKFKFFKKVYIFNPFTESVST